MNKKILFLIILNFCVLSLKSMDTSPREKIRLFSPLMRAVSSGALELCQKLIKDGNANINYQDSNGLSAVVLAVCFCKIEIAKLLIQAGADVDIMLNSKLNFGEKLIDAAKELAKTDKKMEEIVKLIEEKLKK